MSTTNPPARKTITPAAARRIAIAAQGLDAAPVASISMRQVQRVIDTVAQFQIDSVNVCERAHYFPLFSRLGPYDRGLLDRTLSQHPRRMFEYLGHAASAIDVRLQPFLRFRMARADRDAWQGIVRAQRENPHVVDDVRQLVTERGPVTARQLEEPGPRSREHWGWNWSLTKTVMEWLWWKGELTPVGRNAAFERIYDLTERVLPSTVLAAETPSAEDSHVELVRRAARALGIATPRCLADYFRTKNAPTRAAIAHLAASGELIPMTVPGWGETWLWHGSRQPRAVQACALLSPFDSMVFERARVEALFGLRYRIGIYTPAAQRDFGYYVYLFLWGDDIVALVDLKSDRARGSLLVQAVWRTPGSRAHEESVVQTLVGELQKLATWQNLSKIECTGAGDLGATLCRYV